MAAGQKFLAVVEQSPEDRRALGNWGNALCLRAELAQDPEVSSAARRARAPRWSVLNLFAICLVFLHVWGIAMYEAELGSGCGEQNCRSMCSLSYTKLQNMQVAYALYEAAVAKYEAVLEMDPRNRPILRNCAFAMYDLGRLQPDPASRAARQLLEVSSNAIAACAVIYQMACTCRLICCLALVSLL